MTTYTSTVVHARILREI